MMPSAPKCLFRTHPLPFWPRCGSIWMHGLTPCPSGHNTSHFRTHGSHPALFLNPPTLLAPNHPIFELAVPFWLRHVPFLDAPTPPCPSCPVFGHANPFVPAMHPFLDAPTPSGPNASRF